MSFVYFIATLPHSSCLRCHSSNTLRSIESYASEEKRPVQTSSAEQLTRKQQMHTASTAAKNAKGSTLGLAGLLLLGLDFIALLIPHSILCPHSLVLDLICSLPACFLHQHGT